MEIPVYLFTGFLESGKTKFIQGFLEDGRFNTGDNTLLLICEEGEEEYNSQKFNVDNLFLEYIEDEELICEEYLLDLQKKYDIRRVIVEYNGMWSITRFLQEMPEEWIIYQEMTFGDAGKFLSYNKNMRQLTVDKLMGTNMLILNRTDESIDREEIHKIVRGVSKDAEIAYEFEDGRVEYDEIEDPLPFDIDADVIEIADEDYALWYRDLSDEMDKYVGKTVKFKAIVAHDENFPKYTVVVGRHVMVCCEEDITYRGLVATGIVVGDLKKRDWVVITGKITKDYHMMYEGTGPVLCATEVKRCKEPKQQVATFY